MKNKFTVQTLVIAALVLVGGLTEIFAQKRSVRRPTTGTTAPRAINTTAPRDTAVLDVKQGAQKVADQSNNLSRFLFTLGGVAERIRAEDAAVRNGESDANAAQQNSKNKQLVVTTIRNIRDGLDKLETEFRFNEKLKPAYGKIYGISVLAETAETLASRGNFDSAGKQLLEVVYKLNDALLQMK